HNSSIWVGSSRHRGWNSFAFNPWRRTWGNRWYGGGPGIAFGGRNFYLSFGYGFPYYAPYARSYFGYGGYSPYNWGYYGNYGYGYGNWGYPYDYGIGSYGYYAPYISYASYYNPVDSSDVVYVGDNEYAYANAVQIDPEAPQGQ